MDPIKINKLIEEDSLSTRGINFNETLTSAKIHKQKLDEEEEEFMSKRNDREMLVISLLSSLSCLSVSFTPFEGKKKKLWRLTRKNVCCCCFFWFVLYRFSEDEEDSSDDMAWEPPNNNNCSSRNNNQTGEVSFIHSLIISLELM